MTQREVRFVSDEEQRRAWVSHQTQPSHQNSRWLSLGCQDDTHDCHWCRCRCHRIFAEAQGMLRKR